MAKKKAKKKTKRKRNYRKEYEDYHGKPKQRANRSKRNGARRKLGLGVGNPKEADHKTSLKAGGSNRRSNLRAVSRTTNRRKGSRSV
jgi:hypothetical protein